MTDLELTLKALEAGILPSFNSDELKQLFETCEPEDARRMKRKFRKLWRQQRAEELRSSELHASQRQRIKSAYERPAARRRSVKNKLIFG